MAEQTSKGRLITNEEYARFQLLKEAEQHRKDEQYQNDLKLSEENEDLRRQLKQRQERVKKLGQEVSQLKSEQEKVIKDLKDAREREDDIIKAVEKEKARTDKFNETLQKARGELAKLALDHKEKVEKLFETEAELDETKFDMQEMQVNFDFTKAELKYTQEKMMEQEHMVERLKGLEDMLQHHPVIGRYLEKEVNDYNPVELSTLLSEILLPDDDGTDQTVAGLRPARQRPLRLSSIRDELDAVGDDIGSAAASPDITRDGKGKGLGIRGPTSPDLRRSRPGTAHSMLSTAADAASPDTPIGKANKVPSSADKTADKVADAAAEVTVDAAATSEAAKEAVPDKAILSTSKITGISTEPIRAEPAKLVKSKITSVSTEPIQAVESMIKPPQLVTQVRHVRASSIDGAELIARLPWWFWASLLALITAALYLGITERQMWLAANQLTRRTLIGIRGYHRRTLLPLKWSFRMESLLDVRHQLTG